MEDGEEDEAMKAIENGNPGGAGSRLEPRGERWEELLVITAQVFAERSYRGASLSEIALRMGVRKASLYHYITAKEELLFELQFRVHEKGVHLIRNLPVMRDAAASEELANFILAWSDHLLAYDSPYVPQGRLELEFLTADHAATIREMRRTIRRYLEDLIARGVAEGDFDPELDVSHATNTLFMSLNHSLRWFRPSAEGPTLASWQLQLFLEGFGAR